MTADAGLRVGLGWRPATAWLAEQRPFTEVIAESIDPARPPRALLAAIDRGLVVAVHGTTLSLGTAGPLDRARIAHLAAVARVLRAPIVSEHVAFCRAGDAAAPHFLPVPRTRAQLAVLVDNIRAVAAQLPVPLAVENVAAPLAWPDDELAEPQFLAELVARSGAGLVLDVANLYANLLNHGGDAADVLARLPLDRVAYLHIAGGARIGRMWRDTHAHPIAPGALALLRDVLARTGRRPVILERDDRLVDLADRAAIEGELAALDAIVAAAPADAMTVEIAALPASQHARLVAILGDGALPAVAPEQLAETRAILAAKRARHHDRCDDAARCPSAR